MADIFAIVRGVINMIQNSVCRRATLRSYLVSYFALGSAA